MNYKGYIIIKDLTIWLHQQYLGQAKNIDEAKKLIDSFVIVKFPDREESILFKKNIL